MLKRMMALALCLSMLLLVGCGDKKKEEKPESEPTVSSQEPEQVPATVNNLTGLSIDESKKDLRPVAIMIGNASDAQPVQTGVNKADIIYETEVEGGITRIMCVYKDVASAGQLGSVRSARYPYVDLALGHDAVYAHCGQDNTYCKPHLADIDDVSVGDGVYGGKRIPNGLPSWNTLYTYGDKLLEGIKKSFRTTLNKTENWQDFADEKEEVTLSGGSCKKIDVPFSSSYHSEFNYNESNKLYTRYFRGEVRKDYVNKEITEVKNIFVLHTDITFYPNKYRRKVALEGGDGYYVSGGNYMKIKWSKGAANNSFKFTDEGGNPIKVNAGKSYVCIADKSRNPVIG